MTELLPATHTKAEYELVPEGYVHLKKKGVVIHKMPAAFLKRTMKVKKYEQTFDEDTGVERVIEHVKIVKRPPACSLDDYKKDGWERCNRDGSEILNWNGTPKEKPAPKPTKGEA